MIFLHTGQQWLSMWCGDSIGTSKCSAYFSFPPGSVLILCFLSLQIVFPQFKKPGSISTLQYGHFIALPP